jgi:hypothetical protein
VVIEKKKPDNTGLLKSMAGRTRLELPASNRPASQQLWSRFPNGPRPTLFAIGKTGDIILILDYRINWHADIASPGP